MYKNLVIGLLLIIIWGAGYYIIHSGGGEMIRNAYFVEEGTNFNPPTYETVKGIYSCNNKTGCNSKYTILLKEDQTLELISSAEDISKIEENNKVNIERNSIVVNDDISEPVNLADSNSVTVDTSNTTDGENLNENNNLDSTVTENSNVEINSLTDLTDIGSSSLVNIRKGNWDIIQGKILVLIITEEGEKILETPQKFVINGIGSSVLSRISYNKDQFKDMTKPAFIKQEY